MDTDELTGHDLKNRDATVRMLGYALACQSSFAVLPRNRRRVLATQTGPGLTR